MNQEIERKFLVLNTDFKAEAHAHQRIIQGYLNLDPERTVRVRVKGEKAYLTIKGKSSESGLTRFEWEKEIGVEEAEELLKLALGGVIDKTRYLVQRGAHTFEVDEFYGDNEGLIIAEVELRSEDEFFEKPEWLGIEVSTDARYYNSMLMKHPFKDWK